MMDITSIAWNIAVDRIIPPPKGGDPIVREIALKKYADDLLSEQDRIVADFNAVVDVLEGFVLVDKKQTEDWYLDDHESMWWEHDGIDNSLCDLYPGEVQAVEHKQYLIAESNTLYAAKVWDEANDQVGFWEFFKTKNEAEKEAAHCKAMIEAQEQSHD